MAARDIIVIGASAGGFEAIQVLAQRFPPDLPAAVFVTLHLSEYSEGTLPASLNRITALPAANAIDGEPIHVGRIYVAPPDHHLILEPGQIRLSRGPRENMQRPSINTMFRSAAAAYGERVAGVLLTGRLDDGAAGLWEIQQHHGATIVQDPDEATFRSMPDSAIHGLNVQFIVRLEEMGPLLARLSMADNNRSKPGDPVRPVEERSAQVCPQCGGSMTSISMGNLREYRCHIGHRFGLETMISEKTKVVERSKETALSQSEELLELLEQAIARSNGQGFGHYKLEMIKRKGELAILRRLVNEENHNE